MTDKKVEKLRSLAQLDIDAIGTYDAAMKRLSNSELLEKFGEFRSDHQKHVQRLNDLIVAHGGAPVEEKPDFKGAALTAFTAATSMMGNEAALLAMIGNEELTTHTYHAALKFQWEERERVIIEAHYTDERRHLQWIKQAALRRDWAHRQADAHP